MESYLATIIGSSSCLVNFAVSLLLTNADSASARLLDGATGRSFSVAFSLCKTRSSRKIFDVGASSASNEMVGCGERLRTVRSSERAVQYVIDLLVALVTSRLTFRRFSGA